jgi:hypothetical protein
MFHTGEDQPSLSVFSRGGRSVADTPPGQNGTGTWNTMFVDFVAVVALSLCSIGVVVFLCIFCCLSLLRIPSLLFPHPHPFLPSLSLIDTLMPDIKIKSSFLYFLRL